MGVGILGELKIRVKIWCRAGNEAADGCVLLPMPVCRIKALDFL